MNNKNKSIFKGAVIVLAVSIAVLIIGAVLAGITLTGSFNLMALAGALQSVGMLSAVLSGLIVVAMIIISAVKNAFDKNDNDKSDNNR